MARPLINFSTTCSRSNTENKQLELSGVFPQSQDGESAPYLSGRSVRVDGDLARASSMTVDGGAHLLSHQQGGNLLLRGDKLPGLGLLQGFADESGVALDVCPREALAYPDTSVAHTFLRFALRLK